MSSWTPPITPQLLPSSSFSSSSSFFFSSQVCSQPLLQQVSPPPQSLKLQTLVGLQVSSRIWRVGCGEKPPHDCNRGEGRVQTYITFKVKKKKMVSKWCIITVLPCLHRRLLILNSSTTDFLKQSYKEPMCACLLDTGTQALREWFLAPFRPLREQRNQPGENHIDEFTVPIPLYYHDILAKLS